MRDLFNEQIKGVIICPFKSAYFLEGSVDLEGLHDATLPCLPPFWHHNTEQSLLINSAGSWGPRPLASLNPDGAFGASPSKVHCHNCI